MTQGSKRLRAWIERSKINQRQAAELLGMHEVYLSQLLSGDRNPGLSTAHKIEDVAGVSTRSWEQTVVSTDEPRKLAAVGKPSLAKR